MVDTKIAAQLREKQFKNTHSDTYVIQFSGNVSRADPLE